MNDQPDWRDSATWYTYETTFIRGIKFLVGSVMNRIARVERIGFEHLPSGGGCILASNHINDFDIIYMTTNLPRHPFFMAKKELFANPIFGAFIRLGGSFPVDRGAKDSWALAQAGRVLEAGRLLYIFPEGTRSRDALLKRGKIGAVKLALEHQVPIVPAAIWGTQSFRFRPGHPIRLQLAEPLDVSALAGPPPYEYHTMRELTTLMMSKIAAMLPSTHRGVYGE